MGQNSLRHGNNFLDAACSPRRGQSGGLAKRFALHVFGCPVPPSDGPDPVAPAFPMTPNPAHAGHSQPRHTRASVEVPATKEEKHIAIRIQPLLRILALCEFNYISLHDLFLAHLFALYETFQVICKEASFLPLPTPSPIKVSSFHVNHK